MVRKAIVTALCALALCGCHVAQCDTQAETCESERGEAVVVDRADGMPLDVISYSPPAWLPHCVSAYEMHDRITGDSWWVLEMSHGPRDTEYIVLPLTGTGR